MRRWDEGGNGMVMWVRGGGIEKSKALGLGSCMEPEGSWKRREGYPDISSLLFEYKSDSQLKSPKSRCPDEERIQVYFPASERNLAVAINPVFYSVAEVGLLPYYLLDKPTRIDLRNDDFRERIPNLLRQCPFCLWLLFHLNLL
jgi:hypothetical protein